MQKGNFSWSLAGGVVAGVAASLCCLGPLVSLGLGLGSFAAATWFAQWRPVLLAITFALLGLAWYLAYRRSSGAAPGAACSPSQGKFARISLGIGTLLAVTAAIYPALPVAQHRINPAAVAATDDKFTVLIPSMDCPPCAAGIAASLARAPGVKQAAVTYASKQAILVYDPHVTSRDQLLALIDATGFPADRSSVK